jgi:hypothetical protein
LESDLFKVGGQRDTSVETLLDVIFSMASAATAKADRRTA